MPGAEQDPAAELTQARAAGIAPVARRPRRPRPGGAAGLALAPPPDALTGPTLEQRLPVREEPPIYQVITMRAGVRQVMDAFEAEVSRSLPEFSSRLRTLRTDLERVLSGAPRGDVS